MLRTLLRELCSRYGVCVLLCSHVLGAVERACDRIYVLSQGVAVAEGAAAAIVKGAPGASDLEEAFIPGRPIRRRSRKGAADTSVTIRHATFERVGADYRQWRALVVAMHLRVRRSASVFRLASAAGAAVVGMGRGLACGLIGVLVALLVAGVESPSGSASSILAMVMTILGTMLLTDFGPKTIAGTLRSVGHYAVSDRTFILAGLADLLRYAYTTALLTAGLVPLVVGFREGAVAGLAWALALAVQTAFVALFVGTVYALASRRIGGGRSHEWGRDGQFVAIVVAFAGALLMPLLVPDSGMGPLEANAVAWSVLYPPVWFAGLVEVAAGRVTALASCCAATGVGITVALCSGFCRATLGELRCARDPDNGVEVVGGNGNSREKRAVAGDGVRLVPAELRIASSLIGSQFRHDVRFRMRVLAMVPLGVAVLAVAVLDKLGIGPFADKVDGFMVMGLVHMTALGLPLLWLDGLRYSESSRASWILVSTPTDPGRIVVQSVNCIAIRFMLPLFALIAVTFLWLFEDAWRALAHTALLALVAYVAANLMLCTTRWFLFATPADRAGRYSGGFAGSIVVGALLFAFLPSVLAMAYATVYGFVILSAALVGVALLAQRSAAARARSYVGRVDFAG